MCKKSIVIKQTVLGLLVFIAMFTISCSENEDFPNPKSLIGTTWCCSEFHNPYYTIKYREYRFTSSTECEMWSTPRNGTLTKDSNGFWSTFTNSADKIVIRVHGDVANVYKTTMSVQVTDGDVWDTYTKK